MLALSAPANSKTPRRSPEAIAALSSETNLIEPPSVELLAVVSVTVIPVVVTIPLTSTPVAVTPNLSVLPIFILISLSAVKSM